MKNFIKICFLLLSLTVTVNAQIEGVGSIGGIGIVPQNAIVAASCNNTLANLVVSTTRSDTYWVGFKFTVGSTNITVCSLKRYCLAATSNVHPVMILSSSGVVVSNSVNMSGVSINTYASLSISAVTLTAGTTYIVCDLESGGSDIWYNNGSTITLNGGNIEVSDAYSAALPTSTASFSSVNAGESFGNVNLGYQ